MTQTHATGTGRVQSGRLSIVLLFLAAIVGCKDGAAPAPVTEIIRPVKTQIVSTPGANAGIELPAQVRAASPVDLSFGDVSGRIVELPIAEREGEQVRKGELLAQLDVEGFERALRRAEVKLNEAYSVLDLGRAENERMEKMRDINPDLVSASMLARTQENLQRAEAQVASLEVEVQKAEDRLEHSSLRAPFAGIIARSLVESAQDVQAGEPIVSLQDSTHLEVLVDVPDSMPALALDLEPDRVSAIARFASAPGRDFPLRLKQAIRNAGSGSETGAARLVLEMPIPKEIELSRDKAATVRIDADGGKLHMGRILVPAVAVMTDPDGKDYVWLVSKPELRVHRRDVRIGRLAGTDQIQILDGLTDADQIVVAGVMQLTEGQRVREWNEQETGEAR